MKRSRDLAGTLRAFYGLDVTRSGRWEAALELTSAHAADLGYATMEEFVASWSGPRCDEAQRVVGMVTVQHSFMFREPTALEAALEGATAAARKHGEASVWVPGCARGEDVFSLLVAARARGLRVTVVGTDIHVPTLANAQRGWLPRASCQHVPPPLCRFLSTDEHGDVVVDPEIRAAATFSYHSITDPAPAPPKRGFDVVLCRNVLPYLRRESARCALEHIERATAASGLALFGAADDVGWVPPGTFPREHAGYWELMRRAEVHAWDGAVSSLGKPAVRAAAIAALEHGHACATRGDIAGAAARYAEAVQADPLFAEAHLFLGIACHRAGDFAAAGSALRTARELEPDMWVADFYLGECAQDLGCHEDAEAAFRRALRGRTRPLALVTVGPEARALLARQDEMLDEAERMSHASA